MKVLITKEQFRSIISEQKKEDPKPKIVGKDNMYNRLVKAFGSKIVGKFKNPEFYDFYLPNKDWILISLYEGKWDVTYYPEENPSPLAYDTFYSSNNGLLELNGDLDFKITFENNDGTYDSQTKKWNGSSDVKPLPKREDPTSIIQSNDTYRRLYKFYGNKLKVTHSSSEGNEYGVVIELDQNLRFLIYPNYMGYGDLNSDDVMLNIERVGTDDFKIKLEDGRIFDSQTKKWTKGKPFKTVSIEGKNITEFASNLIKNTKNLKIDLDSMKIDVDNFKINFNTTENGTQVYELYLSLNSSKDPYNKPESILNNFPKSKIIGRGNFPNKPEFNYTLIAIIA
jgi:hypothetical protein